MLTVEEIKKFIDDDAASEKKRLAKIGQDYYEGNHDIKKYRIFYYDTNGKLQEDKTRSNIKISHPFFMELVDQEVQYILSGDGMLIKSKIPELQTELNTYFNQNEDFMAELSDVLTGCVSKGFEYMYAYKNENNKLSFQCADCMGVIEVSKKDAEDKCEYKIYWYTETIKTKKIKRIQVWDDKQVYFYVQEDDGAIKLDESETNNPRPHILYKKEGDDNTYYDALGYIPFFRLDNNKKKFSGLRTIKDIIDDYDLMKCGLSNNLVDFDMPIHVVKGFEGDNLDELQQNLKTKKIIGMESTETGAGVEIKTVDIPYEARKANLELDEKNIYRFGMGLNMSGLKDTNATTNIAIKAAYSLLELKCTKLEIRLKQFLRKIIKVVLQEINKEKGTDYRQEDVYFDFQHEIMSNASENADIKLKEAQEQQTRITTLLNLAAQLDNETLMKAICDVLDIDYEEIKDKLPDPNEAYKDIKDAEDILNQEDAKDQVEEIVGGSSS